MRDKNSLFWVRSVGESDLRVNKGLASWYCGDWVPAKIRVEWFFH